MGNHHGHHHSKSISGNSTPSSSTTAPNSNNSSRKSITRTASGADIQEKPSPLLPLEKLAKILLEKSQKEENANGITESVFTKYLFPRYPILATKLFTYFHSSSKCKHHYINTTNFKQQCEKYLAVMDDDIIRDIIVKMFSEQNGDNDDYIMTPELLKTLLMCTYHISMDHYSGGPQMCLSINKTIKAVVDSCFHNKNQLSIQFVSHWLATNCPRLLLPLHRFTIHILTTSYRTLEENSTALAVGLDLTTPVLEIPPPFNPTGSGKSPNPHLLHMSMSWLLACALSPVYSRPQKLNTPTTSNGNGGSGGGGNLGLLNFPHILSKIICPLPSHWVVLYDSDDMGLGSNRFLHHVLSYKGPTLIFLLIENNQLFCIASPNEWKESHLYWGGDGSAVIQLLPKFLVLEKSPKMLYLNLSVRGYPHGLRAGSDPRNPIISVDAGFDKMEFRKIPYNLIRIEVWGCGDPVNRETQLEIKRWEVKEAERQRCVKLSAADWLDHPDRYLLELAGRTQYHQNQNQPQ